MNNVVWQPIEPFTTIHGVDAGNNICLDGIQILRGFEYVDGPKQLLTVYENFGKEEASVYLPDDIRLCRAVPLPQPDWASAPAEANWHVVNPDGTQMWSVNEPDQQRSRWSVDGRWWIETKDIDIPLGVDWRLLKFQRPQEEPA